jgi:hypothetical protein
VIAVVSVIRTARKSNLLVSPTLPNTVAFSHITEHYRYSHAYSLPVLAKLI